MIQFSKIREVKSPTRGTSLSAGIDFYIPDFSEEFIKDLQLKNPTIGIHGTEKITIRSHSRILIPSGIKVCIPKGTALIAFNKSGVATKLGLDIGASVIDADYQGEVHISLTNTTDEKVYLEFGQKIIQFILLPILLDEIQETDIRLLYTGTSERGEGGFGSTGIH